MPACLYAKCDSTYYAPTTHQLRVTYASYTRSTHTFKLQYAYYDTRNTIFLRYEMLSFLCPLPYLGIYSFIPRLYRLYVAKHACLAILNTAHALAVDNLPKCNASNIS